MLKQTDLFSELGITDFGKSTLCHSVQANDLVRLPYRMTANQFKLMQYVLTKIDSRKSPKGQIPIKVSKGDLTKALGLTADSKYSEIKHQVLEMRKEANVLFPLPNGDILDAFVFPRVIWHRKTNDVSFFIEESLFPFMFKLESLFTKISYKSIADMKSFYSMRLYQIFISWLNSFSKETYYQEEKHSTYSIDQFRAMLNIDKDKYRNKNGGTQFKDLRKRVIDPAMKEINELTNVSIRYELHKGFRNRVEAITFFYEYTKNEEQVPEGQMSMINPEKEDDPIIDFDWD